MAESRTKREVEELRSRVQAVEDYTRRSNQFIAKRLAFIEVVLLFMIVYFAWKYGPNFDATETVGVAVSKRTDTPEEIEKWGVNQKIIPGQENGTLRTSVNTMMMKGNEEMVSLKQNTECEDVFKLQVRALGHQIDRLKENEQLLKQELKAAMMKLHQDEADFTSRTAALRKEILDLLGDKQSKMAFKLESTVIKREMDHLKQNEAALKQEIDMLKKKQADSTPTAEMRMDFEPVYTKNGKPLIQVERKHEASSISVTEMGKGTRPIQTKEAARKHVVEGNADFTQTYRQEQLQQIDQLRNDIETLRQQLKLEQKALKTTFTSWASSLRQELLDALSNKQSKMASKLESMLVNKEIEHLKWSKQNMKKEIDLLHKMQAATTLKSEAKWLRQEVDSLKLEQGGYEKPLDPNATVTLQEHKEQISHLIKKQQANRESFIRDITGLRDRQEQLQQESNQLIKENEQLFKREIETLKQWSQNQESTAMSGSQEIEELRHENQNLRREGEQTQRKLANLSDCCSQISSTTEECKTELRKLQVLEDESQRCWTKLTQQGQSTESLWRLAALIGLAITILAFFRQHQRIDQLTKKQEVDREHLVQKIDAQIGRPDRLTETNSLRQELVQSINAQRVEIDKLTETQKADKQHLMQKIDAQRVEIDKLTETQITYKQHLMQKIDAQTGRLDQAYGLIWSMRYLCGTRISAKILTCWSQSRGSLQKFVLSRGILCTAWIVQKHFIWTLYTREGLT